MSPGDEPHSIAVVGLSALQEALVDVAPSWLTERESLVFERADLAATAIVVLDGRSRDAQGVLAAHVHDPKKAFVVVGGSQRVSHPHMHAIDPPRSRPAMAATLMNLR